VIDGQIVEHWTNFDQLGILGQLAAIPARKGGVGMGSLHDVRFPGESDGYRSARDELLEAEVELRRQIARTAALRAQLPLGGEVQQDYAFEEWDAANDAPRTVHLSELFGARDTLFLYSFMWVPESQRLGFTGPCPSCTSIIDGIDGQAPHIAQRISFAVAAKGPIGDIREHARRRGWRHARLLSSTPSAYSRDYHAEDANGSQWPLATVFVRRAGRAHHFWSSELWLVPRDEGQDPRHVDFMWPLWAIFDRTPGGRGDFHPSLAYDGDGQ
jgi:predicted dithiol-disulfide oxidoreductase (DUF899 family)